MAYGIIQQDNDIAYNVRSVVVNTLEDIGTLPTKWSSGSTALVLENSAVYMLSVADPEHGLEKQWIEI